MGMGLYAKKMYVFLYDQVNKPALPLSFLSHGLAKVMMQAVCVSYRWVGVS